MPDIYHIINTIIAAAAAIVAIASFRRKGQDKENELSKEVAVLKQRCDTEKLEERITASERHNAVLEERVSNLTHLMDKIDNTIDKVLEEIHNDKDK